MVVGCTSTNLPATTSESDPQDTGTLPGSNPANLTLEPSPMVTTPETEPSDSEVPPSDVSSPTAEPVILLNPGFEDQEASGNPTGWNHAGAVEASYIEDRGHSGDSRLTHQSSEAYQVETSQTVSGLESDWYTLRAWVRSSGGQRAVYVALRCGADERRVVVPPTTPGNR